MAQEFKTFMMISNLKKTFDFYVYTNIFQRQIDVLVS